MEQDCNVARMEIGGTPVRAVFGHLEAEKFAELLEPTGVECTAPVQGAAQRYRNDSKVVVGCGRQCQSKLACRTPYSRADAVFLVGPLTSHEIGCIWSPKSRSGSSSSTGVPKRAHSAPRASSNMIFRPSRFLAVSASGRTGPLKALINLSRSACGG